MSGYNYKGFRYIGRRAVAVFLSALLIFALVVMSVACSASTTDEVAMPDDADMQLDEVAMPDDADMQLDEVAMPDDADMQLDEVTMPDDAEIQLDAAPELSALALEAYMDMMQRLTIGPGDSGAYDIDFSVVTDMELLGEDRVLVSTSGNMKMIVDGDDMQAAIIMHMIRVATFGSGTNILEMYIEVEDGETQFSVFFDGEEFLLSPAAAEELFEEVSYDVLYMPEIELEAIRTVEIEEVDNTRVMHVVLDGRTLTDFALASMSDMLEDFGEPGVDFAFFLDDMQMTIVTDLANNPLSLTTDMQVWVDVEGEELVVSEKSEYTFRAFGAAVEIDLPVESAADPQVEPPQGTPAVDLSDDFDSLTFSLNGELYTFPIPFAELEARGWVAASFMVDPHQRRANLQIRNGNQSMIVHFINLTDEELPLNETYVYAIFTRFDHAGPPQVTLPGNITIGMTYEEVLATHGEPTRREVSRDGDTELLRYQMDFGYAFMRIDRASNLVISMNMGMSDRAIRDEFIVRRPAPEVPLPTGPIDPAPAGLSEDMFSFMFSLNGIIYTLSTPFSELAADGWEGDDLDREMLVPGAHSRSIDLRNGDQTILVTFFNPTEEEVPLSESVVRYITAYEDWHGRIQLVFPKNIRMGSTYEDLIEAYGEPDSYTDQAPLRTHAYLAEDVSVHITVNMETELVVGLTMNDNRMERQVDIPEFATDDFPISVLDYEAPTSLSDDLNSFIVRIDGDLYRLPAPIAEFVNNGWEFPDIGVPINDLTIDPAGRGTGVGIERDGGLIMTRLRNYDDDIRPVTHTFVVRVDLDFSNPETALSVELPGGITADSTMEEVMAVFGQPADIVESSGRRTYYFGQEYAGIAFTVHMRTEEIQEIVITHCLEDRDDTIIFAPTPVEGTETHPPEVPEGVEVYQPEPSETEDVATYYPEPPETGGRGVMIIVLLLAVAVLAGGGAGWCFHRLKQQSRASKDED